MFSSILVANRGEIAVRIIRTCREMGVEAVLAHSSADRGSLAWTLADRTVQIGPAASAMSYANPAAVISAALQAGVEAVHPGYGFLSEDGDFAVACQSEGITFIGPPGDVLTRLCDKAAARSAAAAAGLPVLPGSDGACPDSTIARDLALEVGFPVIVKAVAGGGGRGMAVASDPQGFADVYARTRTAAQTAFGDSAVYLERYLESARHVEVQVLADRFGHAVHLGARDCSVQRARQKLIEESPPPGLPPELVDRMCAAAAAATRALGYRGAGTLEFLVDPQNGEYYFMEINCRIQVEHPVTEMVTGLDLVREQLLIAAGEPLTITQPEVSPRGAAIECRINAEDPSRSFLPTPGRIDEIALPAGPFTRTDTHCRAGTVVTADYDALLAKVVVWAPDRVRAVAAMRRALGETRVGGVCTTVDFLDALLADPRFAEARHTTRLVDELVRTPDGRAGRVSAS